MEGEERRRTILSTPSKTRQKNEEVKKAPNEARKKAERPKLEELINHRILPIPSKQYWAHEVKEWLNVWGCLLRFGSERRRNRFEYESFNTTLQGKLYARRASHRACKPSWSFLLPIDPISDARSLKTAIGKKSAPSRKLIVIGIWTGSYYRMLQNNARKNFSALKMTYIVEAVEHRLFSNLHNYHGMTSHGSTDD